MNKVFENIELRTNLVKIVLKSVPDKPGTASQIFSSLGEAGFNVEMITQTSTTKEHCDIAFTIKADETEKVLQHLKEKLPEIKVSDILVDRNVAMISIFGKELAHTPGIAGRVFSILAQKGINIEMISASLTVLSCLVQKDFAEAAVVAIKTELK
ncbi:MAG: ACT domain-containing protein [candidate division WOR-3 bacterium]